MKRKRDYLDEDELMRLKGMLLYEEEAYQKGCQVVAGLDEAGRGPVAGPVVAAACILPKGLLIPQIDDSKKLTPQVRQRLFIRLTEDPAIFYGIGIIDSVEIDR